MDRWYCLAFSRMDGLAFMAQWGYFGSNIRQSTFTQVGWVFHFTPVF